MSEAVPRPDVVDQAAAAVRAAAVPPLPEGVMAATVAAVRTQVAAARRARRRKHLMRYATMCGAIAAVGVGVGVLWGGGSAQASLLKALENQAKAQSFRAVTKTVMTGSTVEMPAMPEQKMYTQTGKVRVERGDMVTVSDGKRMVMFDSKAKVARTLDLGANAKDLAARAAGVQAAFQPFMDALQGKPNEKVKPAPAADIGGKSRPGFKASGITLIPGQTSDVTCWLDQEKNLPLRTVMVMTSATVTTTSTTDYLAYNEELDEKLFEIAIPADYKQEILKLPAMDFLKAAAPVVPAAPAGDAAPASLTKALENVVKSKSFRAVEHVRSTRDAAPAGGPPGGVREFFQGGTTRSEYFRYDETPGETLYLVNLFDGKRSVMLNPMAKVAETREYAVGQARRGGRAAPNVAASTASLTLTALRGNAKVTPAAAADIGGVVRPGFKVTATVPGLDRPLDVTYWLDTQKNLPVRLENTTGGPDSATATTDYLGFDEKLDAKLFDMTVPAGYEEEVVKVPAPAKPPAPKGK